MSSSHQPMSSRVVVYQPCYFPKLHYLARIRDADVFIIFDDVEFSRRSRQHRAEIQVGSKRWLTIPVQHTGDSTAILNAKVDTTERWQEKHYQTLVHKFGNDAELFADYYHRIADQEEVRLVDVTIPTLLELLGQFDIDTDVRRSSEMDPTHPGDPSEYLANLVAEADGTKYLCGERAYTNYLDEEPFVDREIDIEIQDWSPDWGDGNVCSLEVLFEADDPTQYAR
ncbi:WbqC family protein [Natrarchaeobius sp. A-rgal3]|uniref:WbqC family protein n=1 Tax=Natrarchaeobius versutus TaxID=1679078 RepID=UPI003510639C